MAEKWTYKVYQGKDYIERTKGTKFTLKSAAERLGISAKATALEAAEAIHDCYEAYDYFRAQKVKGLDNDKDGSAGGIGNAGRRIHVGRTAAGVQGSRGKVSSGQAGRKRGKIQKAAGSEKAAGKIRRAVPEMRRRGKAENR